MCSAADPVSSDSFYVLTGPFTSARPGSLSISFVYSSPSFGVSMAFSRITSGSVPPEDFPGSLDLRSGSSGKVVFLSLPLAVDVLSLSVTNLRPLGSSGGPVAYPTVSWLFFVGSDPVQYLVRLLVRP